MPPDNQERELPCLACRKFHLATTWYTRQVRTPHTVGSAGQLEHSPDREYVCGEVYSLLPPSEQSSWSLAK